ncbi:AI-2E family transporter, partial [Candidatus Collierbacteria bacterium]|nr:AI-2E family transporter [Candidatus Collierbacteria bacterium]
VIAGLLELVPNIGPTIAAVPAVLVGFSVSPTHGFMALGLTVLIQQLENNLIVPKIMQQAIGLHPVVTIVSLLVGFELGGPLLAVLSLPIILGIQVVLPHFHPTPSGEGVKLS